MWFTKLPIPSRTLARDGFLAGEAAINSPGGGGGVEIYAGARAAISKVTAVDPFFSGGTSFPSEHARGRLGGGGSYRT